MELVGRAPIVEGALHEALAGRTVLLHGPAGSGKTAILGEVERRARGCARPVASVHRSERLGDVTAALSGAYPEAAAATRERARRGALRMAIDRRPGVLLLDHLGRPSTALKGFLRSLQGTGLGVLAAVDVENATDHRRVRGWHIAYREIEIPPLLRPEIEQVFDAALGRAGVRIHPEDRRRLLASARGRPGWVHRLVARLADPRYFRGDRLLVEPLCVDVDFAIAERCALRLSE
jgi:hypothetical protein